MGQYVGLDVSLEETTVHVLDEQGKRVWHGTCASHPAAIEATIRKHAPEVEVNAGQCPAERRRDGRPPSQGRAEHADQQDRWQ